MEETLELIFGDEIYITDEMNGSHNEICSMDICDTDNTITLYLSKENVENLKKILCKILEDNE